MTRSSRRSAAPKARRSESERTNGGSGMPFLWVALGRDGDSSRLLCLGQKAYNGRRGHGQKARDGPLNKAFSI